MEETASLMVELSHAVPTWGTFNIHKRHQFYQISISINSVLGLKPFKIMTESTSLVGALKQSLQVLKYYWSEKEESSRIIEEMIEELKKDGIIKEELCSVTSDSDR
jgi:predicted restriction endonuclease